MWTLTSLTRFAPRLPTFAPAVRLSCAFAGWDFSPTKSAPASCGPESKHRQTWRRFASGSTGAGEKLDVAAAPTKKTSTHRTAVVTGPQEEAQQSGAEKDMRRCEQA